MSIPVQKLQEITAIVSERLESNGYCRVYFPMRSAMYGKFVKLKDHDELWKKGMVRFVSNTHEEAFAEKQHADNTRIYLLKQFDAIEKF